MQGHNGHKGPEYLNLFSIGPFRPLCPYPLFPDAESKTEQLNRTLCLYFLYTYNNRNKAAYTLIITY